MRGPMRGDGSDNACRGNNCHIWRPPRGHGYTLLFVACKGGHGTAAIPSILFSGCRRYSLSLCRVLLFKDPTSGFILDPPTIPDRCAAGERVRIASQLWVVGCNPLFETWISGCFPARKGSHAPKSSENREKRAVRPHFLDFTRIFSILMPPGMLVAVKNTVSRGIT